MHRSFNRNMRTEQQAQSRRLSVHADSLAARNAELNRQLQGLVVQIDGKVQTDLQKREAEITAMRERSFIQIGGLTGFVILLLVISYIIIHRNANRIKRYKQETADLIERLQQMAKRNEALIASRKKAVHTITHELRTPLTAITGYAGLMRKDCNTDKTGTYIRNIQESSDRMREMLNTLLNFSGWTTARNSLISPHVGFPQSHIRSNGVYANRHKQRTDSDNTLPQGCLCMYR